MNNQAKWALSEDEVHTRVTSYEAEAITDSLMAFGGRLVDANRDRTNHLESKAVLVVGYALGLLGFVLFQQPSVVAGWPVYFLRGASVLAGLALVYGFVTLRVKSNPWLSDSQWFENQDGVMDDADRLKRCHVLALHAANAQIGASNDRKAGNLIIAQGSIMLAGICLAGWAIVG
jgi:hypothetical protein